MPDFVIAADIGGTKIRVAKVSETGQMSHRSETATPPGGGTAVIGAVLTLLQRIPRQNVRALGVDIPGLAYKNGDVWAPNIPGWKRMPLGRRLREQLQLPVIVESDRNAFVVGEAWKGAARDCRDVIFLAVGTGIGAGILVDGHLLRGHRELAGCVGWMSVRDKFLPQYAKVGCLESHAAGIGIGVTASRGRKRKLTAQDVTQLAIQGDKRAQQVLHQAGCYLGLALANLVSILNPEIIVVGGGVAEAGELILKPARQTMKRWAQPIAVRQTRIVHSRLKGAASLLGVAKLAFEVNEQKGHYPISQ
ncbi:MAG TPA: ROK family protein [Acidobacteriaceae bacterium]|jgi:glucokinase|nr:ROK family protein [Acidobacteriaceae bacterium]